MRINKKINKGTTIIELLIYLGLLAIFLTVLLDVFITTLNFKLSSESSSSLNQDIRYIFSKISYDVYNADSFTVPNANELDFVQNGNTFKYTLSSSGDLLKGTDKLNGLNTKVQNLNFAKIGATVTVSLTLQSQIILPGGQSTQSFNTTFASR